MADAVGNLSPFQEWVAILTLVIAVVIPIATNLLGIWLSNKNAQKAAAKLDVTQDKIDVVSEETSKKLDTIHKIVDGKLGEAQKRIQVLEDQLRDVRSKLPPPRPPQEGGTGGFNR